MRRPNAATAAAASLALPLLPLLLLLPDGASPSPYTFAVVPKNKANDFFRVVREGCVARAAALAASSTCLYVGPPDDDAFAQAAIIDGLVDGTLTSEETTGMGTGKGRRVDGIAVSVSDASVTGAAIDRAVAAGVPVVTFDSDAPASARIAYVGTDNRAFGIELGKVLDQLDPEGGRYGILAAGAPNVVARVEGVRERLARTKWREVDSSYKDCLDSKERALEIMHEFAQEGVDAIIPVGGWPMFLSDGWKSFVDANRGLTLVVGDTLPVQLDLMNKGYVNGLVGQLPFNMGEQSIDVLHDLARGREVEETIFGTSLLEVMQFPLVLPEIEVDENLLGGLVWMGYVLYAIVAATSVGLSGWVHVNRKTRVIKNSQPFFLQMIIAGVLVFASAIVPLSINVERHSQRAADISCMATPWLMTVGFTTMFSALYTKTRRINLIFHNPNAFKRIKVSVKDVMKPYLIFMAVNIITLISWTAIAPLTYQRFDYPGTDDWNRVIATYGACVTVSEEGERNRTFAPFLAIITTVNMGLLFLANVHAYRARSIQTEYSESKFIAAIMASMFQTFALGTPCIFLLWEVPRAYFTVMVLVITVVSLSALALAFGPKFYYIQKLREETEERDRRSTYIRNLVIKSQDGENVDGNGDPLNRMPSARDSIGLRIAIAQAPVLVRETSYKPERGNESINLSSPPLESIVEGKADSFREIESEDGLGVYLEPKPAYEEKEEEKEEEKGQNNDCYQKSDQKERCDDDAALKPPPGDQSAHDFACDDRLYVAGINQFSLMPVTVGRQEEKEEEKREDEDCNQTSLKSSPGDQSTFDFISDDRLNIANINQPSLTSDASVSPTKDDRDECGGGSSRDIEDEKSEDIANDVVGLDQIKTLDEAINEIIRLREQLAKNNESRI